MSIRNCTSVVEFAYEKARPKATVQLKVPGHRSLYFEMLIDSGADYSIISQYDASRLGIEYDRIENEEKETEMADHSTMKTKETNVLIIINNIEIHIPIHISKKHLEPIMGRRGVFDAFDILFQQRKNIVTFTRV